MFILGVVTAENGRLFQMVAETDVDCSKLDWTIGLIPFFHESTRITTMMSGQCSSITIKTFPHILSPKPIKFEFSY